MRVSSWILAATLMGSSGWAMADAMMDAIADLQHGWAKGYYSTPEKQQEAYFDALQTKSHEVTAKFSGRVEALIWEGIITSSHAKFQNKLVAGENAKAARDLLLAAEKIDPNALDGSALTSLGSMYYKVPRIISFGDHTKARSYLERALKVNPNGIDPNFFMAEFLVEKGEKAKAIEYLKRAQAAPARPGREDADAGRRAEIQDLLSQLK
ncbi:tetratricopeptide repeat protein [Ferriphaselus sp. R-1]|uniref:tetratricopeptide repeat protein n=1 Tax=Ferriphaselus sp. R-1 TaxID=1485544 RepID=UPI0005556FC5|nr:tetratricopeptide repeat protein [Ferriphaselus sp. R-1]